MLGEYDAVNEFIELIIRDFKKIYKTQSQEIDFLKEKSKEHNIIITSYNADLMYSKITQNYIVSVQQCFETFLKQIYEEGKNLGKQGWSFKEKEDTWLTCVTKNVLSKEQCDELDGLIEICDYYNKVRNFAVHDLSREDEIAKAYRDLQNIIPMIKSRYNTLNAPNKIEHINFDDFILFSRVSKDVAKSIFKHFEYDINKIIINNDFTKYRSFKNNPERLKSAIKGYLQTKYTLDQNSLDDCVEEICREIMAR